MERFNLRFLKGTLIPIILFLLSPAQAVELVNEQFASNINGWSVSNPSKVYWKQSFNNNNQDGFMFIDRRDWGRKTYHFGSDYSNQSMDVEVRWCATSQWENWQDFLRIKVNGSTV